MFAKVSRCTVCTCGLCVMTYGQLWHEYNMHVHDAQCMVNTYVVVHPTVTHGLKVGAMLTSLNPLMS